MRKRFNVEVDCANCATKMEEAAKKVDGVEDASIAFMTQKMTVTFADGTDADAVMDELESACKRIERDFSIER